jgi:hypothetical protein
MSNLSELLPTGGGQNAVDFVASGTLSSGQTVALNSDGTVASATGVAVSDTFTSEVATNGSSSVQGGYVVAHDPDNNKTLLAYGDMENSQYGYARIATIAQDGTTTLGTKVAFKSAAVGKISAAYVGNGSFVIVWTDDIGTYMRSRALTVSGTAITYGTEVVLNSNATYISPVSLVYNPVVQACAVIASKYGYVFMFRFTVSGNAITNDAAAGNNINDILGNANNGSSEMALTINSTTGELFAVWKKSSAGVPGYGGAMQMSAGGGADSFTGGTAVRFDGSSGVSNFSGLAYDSTNDRYVVVYQNDTNDYMTANVASVASGATTWGTETVFKAEASSTTGNGATSFNPNTNKIVTLYRKDGSPLNVKYVTGSVSGLSVTWSSETYLSPAALSTYNFTVYNSTIQRTLVSYVRSSVAYIRNFLVGGTQPNYTSFIGITAEAISDTATGAVNVYGGINEAQSGLTIGSDYYVQADGSLSTTTSTVKVGKAISATTINMMDLT